MFGLLNAALSKSHDTETGHGFGQIGFQVESLLALSRGIGQSVRVSLFQQNPGEIYPAWRVLR